MSTGQISGPERVAPLILALAFGVANHLAGGTRSPRAPRENADVIPILLQSRQVAAEVHDLVNKEVLLGDIAEAFVKADAMNAALETVALIPTEEWQDFVRSHIVGLQLEEQDFGGALVTAGAIRSNSERAEALCSIASAQAKAGDYEGAKRILLEAINVSAQVKESSEKEVVFGQVALVQSELGDVRAAIQTSSLIGEDSRDRVLGEIVEIRSKSGDVEGIREIATAISEKERAPIIGLLAEAYARHGNLETALRIARRIEDEQWRAVAQHRIVGVLADKVGARSALRVANEIQDRSTRTRALQLIAESQVKAGDDVGASLTYRRAVGVAATSSDQNGKTDFDLAGMAMWWSKVGHIEEALETMGRIPDGFQRASTLRVIALVQAGKGDKTGTISTLMEAVRSAMAIKSPENQAILLDMIASTQAEVGDRSAAVGTFRKAVELAGTIGDDETRALVTRDIARNQAEGGDIRGALSTTALISDSHLKDQALEGIAVAQAKTGDVEAGLKTASSIRKESGYDRTLISIAKVQARSVLSPALTLIDKIHSPYMRGLALLRVAEELLKTKAIR